MRFRHRTTVSLFLGGILILGSGGSGTRAQHAVHGERSLLPVVVPQEAGTATFHNNTVTAIPPTGTLGTTNSTITVSGFPSNAVVFDIKVSFHLTHTFDSDLAISLISPGGAATVPLSTGRGANGDNYGVSCNGEDDRTRFDDAATSLIVNGTAPFKAAYRPESPLSAFKGGALTWFEAHNSAGLACATGRRARRLFECLQCHRLGGGVQCARDAARTLRTDARCQTGARC